MIRLAMIAACLMPLPAWAQAMELGSGALTVNEGTRISIVGPVTWHIASGAAVVNHGWIDLGAEGSLNEAPGAAITGSGVETVTRSYAIAFTGEEPGGLGLTLGMDAPMGTLLLTRGHLPVDLPNGASSISRWYLLESSDQPGAVLDVQLRYDPLELNGLDADALELHKAQDADSYWLPLPGQAEAPSSTVRADMAWPWAFLSAFEADVVTRVEEETTAGFLAWPTLASNVVQLAALGSERVLAWQLRDAAGRLLAEAQHAAPGLQTTALDVSPFASGTLFLRVNGQGVIKLVKQ